MHSDARIAYSIALATSLLLAPSVARAVPGPDSVAVLANAGVPESVALAQQYATARDIPARQVCTVTVPDTDSITLADFRTLVLTPFQACLAAAGVTDRIEAVVVAKGLPLVVNVPAGGTATQAASLAAVLGAWHSTVTADSSDLIGHEPGANIMCGTSSCYGARWNNPFTRGVFSANWTMTLGGVAWHPLLVTMLDGRSYADAAMLITSATSAEHTGGARGEFELMAGADSARGVLDTEYPRVATALTTRGFTMVTQTPFDTNQTGHSLAGFFTGTASLGMTIEGNTYAPGALVDNLTSYGAVPGNFHATGESQVSIARWVARGVAGAHGTVAEPLNNCFPSRELIVDYVDGSTLGEAYFRNMPYAYWRNLVLGDPMCAPYATRPVVTITGVAEGDTVAGMRRVSVTATDPMSRGIASVALYVDGVEAMRVMGASLEACISVPPGDARQVLAVAQVADDGSMTGAFQPKGWSSVSVHATGGAGSCDTATDASVALDASSPHGDAGRVGDGSLDGGGGSPHAGCGCRTVPRDTHASLALAALALSVVARRRKRAQ